MKYTIILTSLIAGAFALPNEGSTITSAPASVATMSGLTSQQSCALYSCVAGDVTCQASCLGIAHPNSSQAVQTNECAEKCDQGDGSPAATEKYSECVQACIASYFPTSQTAGAAVQAASQAATNSASATGSAASAKASGTGASVSATGSSGTASSASSTGAANANDVQIAGVGFAGLVLAFFAL